MLVSRLKVPLFMAVVLSDLNFVFLCGNDYLIKYLLNRTVEFLESRGHPSSRNNMANIIYGMRH